MEVFANITAANNVTEQLVQTVEESGSVFLGLAVAALVIVAVFVVLIGWTACQHPGGKSVSTKDDGQLPGADSTQAGERQPLVAP